MTAPMAATVRIDRRMIVALRLRDALGAAVRGPVTVGGAGVRWVRTASGDLVVTGAAGFADYAASFPDAPAVAPATLTLDLRPGDPGLAPRRLRVPLPRSADRAAPDALGRAVEVTLPPSVSARPSGLAAGLLVTLRHADGRRVEGALVRLRPPGGAEAVALTNAAGEALALVGGLRLAAPGPGATVTPETAADLDAVIDADAVRLHAEADLPEARAAERRRSAGFPDPEAIAEALAAGAAGLAALAPVTVALRPGETRTAALTWSPA